MKKLTGAEQNLLSSMLECYCNDLSKDIDNVRQFISFAHITGDIASAGDKYTENKKFFEVKDNIVKHIETQKREARNLINTILNNC